MTGRFLIKMIVLLLLSNITFSDKNFCVAQHLAHKKINLPKGKVYLSGEFLEASKNGFLVAFYSNNPYPEDSDPSLVLCKIDSCYQFNWAKRLDKVQKYKLESGYINNNDITKIGNNFYFAYNDMKYLSKNVSIP